MLSRTLSPRLRATYRNLAAWTLQSWLAMFFIGAGYAKLTQSADHLDILLGWTKGYDLDVIRAVGAIEIGLAVMLLLPLISWRWGRGAMTFALATLAAAELAMIGVHAVAGSFALSLVNIILFFLTAATVDLRFCSAEQGSTESANSGPVSGKTVLTS